MRAMLDPKDFVADPEEIAAPEKSSAKSSATSQSKQGIQFYQFPAAVMDALIQTDYTPVWRLVAAVFKGWYKGHKNPNPVRLTSALLAEFRISKRQEWKALKILEQSNQFLVERSCGRNPLVMMRWKPTKD
jgi:hypothetical protein